MLLGCVAVSHFSHGVFGIFFYVSLERRGWVELWPFFGGVGLSIEWVFFVGGKEGSGEGDGVGWANRPLCLSF